MLNFKKLSLANEIRIFKDSKMLKLVIKSLLEREKTTSNIQEDDNNFLDVLENEDTKRIVREKVLLKTKQQREGSSSKKENKSKY